MYIIVRKYKRKRFGISVRRSAERGMVMENNGFVFGQMVNAAKSLGITSEEVEKYREEHECTSEEALEQLIAQK